MISPTLLFFNEEFSNSNHCFNHFFTCVNVLDCYNFQYFFPGIFDFESADNSWLLFAEFSADFIGQIKLRTLFHSTIDLSFLDKFTELNQFSHCLNFSPAASSDFFFSRFFENFWETSEITSTVFFESFDWNFGNFFNTEVSELEEKFFNNVHAYALASISDFFVELFDREFENFNDLDSFYDNYELITFHSLNDLSVFFNFNDLDDLDDFYVFSFLSDADLTKLGENAFENICVNMKNFNFLCQPVDSEDDDVLYNFFNLDLNETGDDLFKNVFKNIESPDLASNPFFEDLTYFENLTNLNAIYHYSIPNTKLAYPEPFIASASFIHTDLWFVHILIYQYWLWFIFIFLIIFFFLTFVSVVRWCNMRVRPRRETRGVSRSKCGDLITACVPVSWATSIIVNESTDAMDFYDGFGTTELVIGVRAYQWGWEYYYPKDIDLNYNVKKNYSTFIGNSIKYNTSSDVNLKTNNLWKFYQNKNSDQSIIPAHFLLFSLDSYKLLNFLNFSDLGINILSETAAFKKTKSFFKVFSSNSFYGYSEFNLKYKKISSLYTNDLTFFDSQSYVLKRNHSYLTSNVNNNANHTFLNYKSFFKFLSYNHDGIVFKNQPFTPNFVNFKTSTVFKIFDVYFTKFFQKNSAFSNIYLFSKSQSHLQLLNAVENNNSGKKIMYPIFKTLNTVKKGSDLNNFLNFKKLNLLNISSYFQKNDLNFTAYNYKNYIPFSFNESIATPAKHIRNFANNVATLAQNHRTPQLNTMSNYLNFENLKINSGFSFFYNVANSNWLDLPMFLQLSSNKIYFDLPNHPIPSNNGYKLALNYDDCKDTFIENIPTILQGKEDLLPPYIVSAYWNFYWNNSSALIRPVNILSYDRLSNFFYFPLFNLSYDYDFRNWQSLELLEDAFWETTLPTAIYEEYVELFNNFTLAPNLNSLEKLNTTKFELFETNNFFQPSYQFSEKQFYNGLNYFDDFSINLNLLPSQNFSIFSWINNIVVEETYESLKFLPFVFNSSQKNYLNSFSFYFQPHSYSTILNAFRSNYEDVSWYYEKQSFFKIQDFNKKPGSLLNNKFIAQLFFDWEKINLTENFKFVLLNTNRLDNQINLRATAKNSMVTYNALQKVFRTRLDEGRSNTKLLDFTNFYVKQPYLSSNRVSYENFLGKNKTNFYKTNFYKTNFYNNFNFSYNLFLSLNYYIYEFPFLLATKSDASRHSWFDWFAKWGFYEIQPSSSARFAIHGLPHFNKFFNFTSNQNETLNETESYLLRLSKARKNYLPGWTYTPYFYAKNNYWYKNDLFFEALNGKPNNLKTVFMSLNTSFWYNSSLKYKTCINVNFFPTNSNINSYTKTLWKPSYTTASYYFNISTLFDILTKREQMYRQYFFSKKVLVNLPEHVSNKPSNSLVTEIKTMFKFIDPILATNEYSREYYYNSLKAFNFYFFKDSIGDFSKISHFLFFYFFNAPSDNRLQGNVELYKNQYRPLRKGINNMLRLHATGAVAMPIEIRLQILASSKDVIHSWAIPSAGIKIDCVPGYSSHKVMIFLVSGIFWGQCMEICGRYHHWMPIVIYFMKRDLFFLWCTHFVFSANNTVWNINDRQFVNHIKTVSYDKNSWLTELLN